MTLRTLLLCALAASLAACEEDLLADSPDAAVDSPPLPPGVWDCADTPWPTTARDPLAVSGDVINWSSQAIGGAAVEVRDGNTDELIAQATTNPGGLSVGKWAASVPNGGMARKIYRKFSAASYLDTYAYDALPQFAEYKWGTAVIEPARRDAWYQAGGLTPNTTTGVMYLELWDCHPPGGSVIHPAPGATIEAPPGARVLYWNAAGDPDPTLTETVPPYHGAAIVNVTPGLTDVTVKLGAITYRPWPIEVRANAMTISPRHP